ncbi:unnamed protein product, partial [Staurois parvus]
GAPVSLPKLKKAYENGTRGISWGPYWPRALAIRDHGAPVSSPAPRKAYEKANERYQGNLMGPPTDPGPSGNARVLEWSVRPWPDLSPVNSPDHILSEIP